MIYALLNSRLVQALTALVAGALAVLGYGAAQRAKGRSQARSEAARDIAQRMREADEAGHIERKRADGLTDAQIKERIRRRDDEWL